MKPVFAVAALCAVCSAPAQAGEKPHPRFLKASLDSCLGCSFDLGSTGRTTADVALPKDPPVPHGMDTSNRTWTPPNIRLESARGGPIFTASALGSSRKGAPALAHVAIGWDF